MIHRCVLFLILLLPICAQSQQDSTKVSQDSIKKAEFIKYLGNGFLPTKYFDFDLRYLIKYNQFEALRTGLGGITNKQFSEKIRLSGYWVYGFKDDKDKYSISGGFRVDPKRNTWINLTYTDDLQETGSSKFLTDKRFFTFFEPRLLNIDLFHRHITKSISLEHQISSNLLSETKVSYSKINPTYNYNFKPSNESFNTYDLSLATISLQWSPFSNYEFQDDVLVETKEGYPKFTLQYIKSVKDIFNSNFNFSKLDLRTIYQVNHKNDSKSNITLTAGFANGDAPLTHLYHAYPNNIRKETILQRFSVAGLNSFETMLFNEFFSDRFGTLQLKHFFRPFKISEWLKPQLVLISRHALGDMANKERHLGITFNTLDQLYSESGFEINKLFFGFGLSFAYRYGSYHIPNFEDNIAFKFTFNLTL
ncbi:DUF5686 family protein [Ichthyenterobacterium sp. W332]|uniref:DUF5686 family protein n=1 Tax=Microcosmobacter mediterraneus TaxID=3075607 RepID=A0ABU2YL58_9FLAO|nr:DUF5686 family protein [Ichthyenterobacterium sp. W332]MDT0557773.1 DUF5686 family protein [Ichthyenterobacterium sp. W332]